MKTPMIAGNWKMHHGPAATRDFFEHVLPDLHDLQRRGSGSSELEVVIFPPSLSLGAARDALLTFTEAVTRRQSVSGQGEGIADAVLSVLSLGIQHVHPAAAGAFTGELSPEFAKEAGAGFVLVGHSERRALFGETDARTRQSVDGCWRAGLIPVLCVGETLDERRSGQLKVVLSRQLNAVLSDRSADAGHIGGAGLTGDPVLSGPLVLAYEPVWAIGTGETATSADASEAHGYLRDTLRSCLGREGAAGVPILYGGSVRPDNAAALLAAPDVDGLLIGGASLAPDSFLSIVRSAVSSRSGIVL